MGFGAGLGDGWGCPTTVEVMLQASAQLLSHSHSIYLLISVVSTTTALQETIIPLGRRSHGALAQLMAVHSLPLPLRQVTRAGDVRSVSWALWLHIPHGSPPRTSTAHVDLESRDPFALWDLPQYPMEQLCKAEPTHPMVKPNLLLVQTLRNHHPKESQQPGGSHSLPPTRECCSLKST